MTDHKNLSKEGKQMESIKAPRGTRDVLAAESWKWERVLGVCRDVARDFGYGEVLLPIFEHTELFSRGIGDTTDIVEKEMYTFTDKGGRSITLRPELTASVMRCYLEHDMRHMAQPQKIWGWGPMFRYERPQKGRYRQFYQVDFEILGTPSPLADLETIDTSMEIYRRLGLKGLSVLINSVGCPNCRPKYRDALKAYIGSRLGDFCETCQARFERNPLRILDCKNPTCRELTDHAPTVISSLCPECRAHFDAVTSGLSRIGADVRVDDRLVRGLDYYTKTAFEVLAGELGAQNAMCGGGRYDGLAESIGGPHVPGVGFATGVDRVIITMEGQNADIGTAPSPDVWIVVESEAASLEAATAAHAMRSAGLSAEMDFMGRSMKSQMKAASNAGARAVCIIGGDELRDGTAAVKDMTTGEQRTAPRDAAPSLVREIVSKAI